ncbi:MAG: histidine kinase [Actinomycetota bacterium]
MTSVVGERVADRWNLLLSSVWLLFLVFPLVSLLTTDRSPAAKVVAVALLGLFAVVYIHDFKVTVEWEKLLEESGGEPPGPEPWWRRGSGDQQGSVLHLTAMVVVGLLAGLVGGPALLGVAPFIAAAAVFNLRWRWSVAVLAATIAVVVAVPVMTGIAGLWVLTPVTLSVGIAAVLVRIMIEREYERAAFRTGLAVGDERVKVARDVHDVLGHSLTVVVLKVELARRLAERVDGADEASRAALERCLAELAELESISRQALDDIRSTVGGLRARSLADEVTAARSVLADAGVGLTVVGDVAEVPEGLRSTLPWVVREAVTNVVRHADATSCTIAFAPAGAVADEPVSVVLRVSDDGCGVDPAAEGNGLRGLRERVVGAGAELRVRRQDGTHLEVLA